MPKVRHQLDIHSNVMDKQDALQKKSIIYNTKRIEEIIAGSGDGKPDTVPFFHGQQDWRDAGVRFDYTDEELEELDKCSLDCEYFVSHYCKFLNKKGRTLVNLRDYQKRLLNVMGGEHWDPEEGIIMPDHPDIVLMQSRQTGKCVSLSSSIVVEPASFLIFSKINNKKYNIFIFIWKKLKKLMNLEK